MKKRTTIIIIFLIIACLFMYRYYKVNKDVPLKYTIDYYIEFHPACDKSLFYNSHTNLVCIVRWSELEAITLIQSVEPLDHKVSPLVLFIRPRRTTYNTAKLQFYDSRWDIDSYWIEEQWYWFDLL